jgi:hypothetical protein
MLDPDCNARAASRGPSFQGHGSWGALAMALLRVTSASVARKIAVESAHRFETNARDRAQATWSRLALGSDQRVSKTLRRRATLSPRTERQSSDARRSARCAPHRRARAGHFRRRVSRRTSVGLPARQRNGWLRPNPLRRRRAPRCGSSASSQLRARRHRTRRSRRGSTGRETRLAGAETLAGRAAVGRQRSTVRRR